MILKRRERSPDGLHALRFSIQLYRIRNGTSGKNEKRMDKGCSTDEMPTLPNSEHSEARYPLQYITKLSDWSRPTGGDSWHRHRHKKGVRNWQYHDSSMLDNGSKDTAPPEMVESCNAQQAHTELRWRSGSLGSSLMTVWHLTAWCHRSNRQIVIIPTLNLPKISLGETSRRTTRRYSIFMPDAFIQNQGTHRAQQCQQRQTDRKCQEVVIYFGMLVRWINHDSANLPLYCSVFLPCLQFHSAVRTGVSRWSYSSGQNEERHQSLSEAQTTMNFHDITTSAWLHCFRYNLRSRPMMHRKPHHKPFVHALFQLTLQAVHPIRFITCSNGAACGDLNSCIKIEFFLLAI